VADERLEQAFVDWHGPLRATSRATQVALLRGVHPLSGDVRLVPFVVERGGRVVGRCALCLPAVADEGTKRGPARLGFFECVDEQPVADELFDWARRTALAAGYAELVGPVDASFWLRYRMKLDHFDAPYTGEPYNPSYYPRLWERAGWQVGQRYSSTVYRVPPPGFVVGRYDERLAAALAGGRRVAALDLTLWDEDLPKVHALIMRRYAGMPLFHPLSLETFAALFGGLRRIADPQLITLAWNGDELAGFSIVLPDYGDLLDRRLTPVTTARILARKRRYQTVVAAYMASDEPGLGSSMAARLLTQARDRGLRVIGSLIAEGTPTEAFAPELVESRRHYALWRLAL